jgi:hypothetical protein
MYTTQSSGYGFTVPARRPVPVHTTETHIPSRTEWAIVGTTAKKRRAYHQPRITDGVRYPVTVTKKVDA